MEEITHRLTQVADKEAALNPFPGRMCYASYSRRKMTQMHFQILVLDYMHG